MIASAVAHLELYPLEARDPTYAIPIHVNPSHSKRPKIRRGAKARMGRQVPNPEYGHLKPLSNSNGPFGKKGQTNRPLNGEAYDSS